MHFSELDSVLSKLVHASDNEGALSIFKQARADLELVGACNAMLMLEKAFKDHPVASSVTALFGNNCNYEIEVHAYGSDGIESDIDDVLLERVYLDAEPCNGNSYKRDLAPCFAAIRTKTLEAAQAEVSAAMNYLASCSPTLFGDLLGLCIRGGSAMDMAQAAGLQQVATTMEASRLARAMLTPVPALPLGLRI